MPEVLLEDDPPPRKRSRWVDIAGLGAVVAGMLAIGVLGDRGDRDERADPLPTTTTTTERGPRRVPYGPRTETSTTTTPQRRVLGPLFPRETGTTLLVQRGSGAEVVEIDTGIVTPVEGSLVEGSTVVAPGAFFVSGPNLVRVATDGRRDELADVGGRWVVGASDRGVLVYGDREVLELDGHGQPTGRTVRFPTGGYPAGATSRGVLVGQADSLTLVGFDGQLRSLGTGMPVAAAGSVVAKLTCELLRCELQLVDAASGFTRSVPGLEGISAELGGAAMSPDGRWLAVQPGHPDAEWMLVDVAATLHDERQPRPQPVAGVWGGMVAFGAGGSDVVFSFGGTGDHIRAHDLRTGAWRPLEGIVGLDVRALAATASG